MRRSLSLAAAVAGVFLIAGPASASSTSTGDAVPGSHFAAVQSATDGWTPVNYQPYDIAAGVRCDFPVHAEPVVDEVVYKVVETYPDGPTKREVYTGDLVMRYTNTDTGASVDVDASGDAVVDYFQDGSMMWYVKGAITAGFGENSGNLDRGIWHLDGNFTLHFAPDGYKTLNMARGTTHNVCTDID